MEKYICAIEPFLEGPKLFGTFKLNFDFQDRFQSGRPYESAEAMKAALQKMQGSVGKLAPNMGVVSSFVNCISEAIIQVDDYRPGSRNDGVEGEEGLVTFQTKTKFDEVIQQMIKRKFNPQKTSEKKSMKLKEDFIAANQEFDLWFGEVKSLLATDGTEVGGWFIKKKLLVEAYIIANEDKIKHMNEQADSLVDSGQFDSNDIRQRKEDINGRFQTIKRFCKDLYGLYRIIYDEIALINEKKRLLHMGFESELSSHEPAIKKVIINRSKLKTLLLYLSPIKL